ncbi:MAG: SurA N-terminal domain-containing protein [Patescibacteria group bacterium]|nr:SurA N-terminal domain-containing protein [Patescibacteria group bacterium]
MAKSKKFTSKNNRKKQKTKAATAKKEKVTKKTSSKKSKKAAKKVRNQEKKTLLVKATKPLANIFDKKTITVLVVVGVLGVLYIFRGLFVVAIVNGTPIFRFSILRQAEKSQGAQLLETTISEMLIKQEAKEKGVIVTDDELDAEIEEIKKNLEEQDQDFDQLLALQGMTVDDLTERLRLNKLIERLLAGEIEVSDEEMTQYLEDNADFFPEDMEDAEKKETARQQLNQQKMNEKYQEWVEELRNKARIKNFVNYTQ